MREPLYRGQRVNTGETVEGYLVRAEGRINGGRCYITPGITAMSYSAGKYMLGPFYEVKPNDTARRVRARWENFRRESFAGWTADCSNCGASCDRPGTSLFCPHCGAEMESEEEPT